MEAVSITKGKIILSFSPEEVSFLCNAIEVSLKEVPHREYQTRTGETPERARELLGQLRKALDEAQSAP